MANLSAVASEVYTILSTFDYEVKHFDADGNTVYEPEDASRFFCSRKKGSKKADNISVVVDDDNENSVIRLIMGPSVKYESIQDMWETLQNLANKYNMIYDLDVRDEDVQPRLLATKASVRESKGNKAHMNIFETRFSSQVHLENASLLVRYCETAGDTMPARRRAESVIVENDAGEQYELPIPDVAAGQALAQHVNQGGSFYDQVALEINSVAQQFSDLGAAMNHLALMEDASGQQLREMCKEKRKKLRESLKRCAHPSTYTAESHFLKQPKPLALLEGEELDGLREALSIPGRTLPENVLMVCARLIAEEKDASMMPDVLDEDPDEPDLDDDNKPKKSSKEPSPTVRVLGRDVNAEVWTNLVENERIELSRTPDLSDLPNFTSVTAQVFYKMNIIGQVCADDTLGNFLSAVYSDYQSEKYKNDRQKSMLLTSLAVKVCKAAGVKIDTTPMHETIGPRGVNAILEMEQWFRSFDPNYVLLEGQVSAREEDIVDRESVEEDVEITKEDVVLPPNEEQEDADIIIPRSQPNSLALDVVSDGDDEEQDRNANTIAGAVRVTP